MMRTRLPHTLLLLAAALAAPAALARPASDAAPRGAHHKVRRGAPFGAAGGALLGVGGGGAARAGSGTGAGASTCLAGEDRVCYWQLYDTWGEALSWRYCCHVPDLAEGDETPCLFADKIFSDRGQARSTCGNLVDDACGDPGEKEWQDNTLRQKHIYLVKTAKEMQDGRGTHLSEAQAWARTQIKALLACLSSLPPAEAVMVERLYEVVEPKTINCDVYRMAQNAYNTDACKAQTQSNSMPYLLYPAFYVLGHSIDSIGCEKQTWMAEQILQGKKLTDPNDSKKIGTGVVELVDGIAWADEQYCLPSPLPWLDTMLLYGAIGKGGSVDCDLYRIAQQLAEDRRCVPDGNIQPVDLYLSLRGIAQVEKSVLCHLHKEVTSKVLRERNQAVLYVEQHKRIHEEVDWVAQRMNDMNCPMPQEDAMTLYRTLGKSGTVVCSVYKVATQASQDALCYALDLPLGVYYTSMHQLQDNGHSVGVSQLCRLLRGAVEALASRAQQKDISNELVKLAEAQDWGTKQPCLALPLKDTMDLYAVTGKTAIDCNVYRSAVRAYKHPECEAPEIPLHGWYMLLLERGRSDRDVDMLTLCRQYGKGSTPLTCGFGGGSSSPDFEYRYCLKGKACRQGVKLQGRYGEWGGGESCAKDLCKWGNYTRQNSIMLLVTAEGNKKHTVVVSGAHDLVEPVMLAEFNQGNGTCSYCDPFSEEVEDSESYLLAVKKCAKQTPPATPGGRDCEDDTDDPSVYRCSRNQACKHAFMIGQADSLAKCSEKVRESVRIVSIYPVMITQYNFMYNNRTEDCSYCDPTSVEDVAAQAEGTNIYELLS